MELLDKHVYLLDVSIQRITSGHIATASDMKCVSFMARSTLYLSMIDKSNLMWMTEKFSNASSIQFERINYIMFEKHLFDFISSTHMEGKVVWMSPMNSSFVDISNIYLIKIDPSDPLRDRDDNCYVYTGCKFGFLNRNKAKRPSKFSGQGCSMSSHYYTTTPTSTQSLRLTSAAPLARVRECRLMLARLLSR